MISIVVPVYRAENSLHKCVESLVSQTYSDIEIVLVDDGSPDGSGALCEELAKTDKRIVVRHKENGGVSSARNLGIEVARGDYILFVDSDDYVEPDYVKFMADTLSEYSNNIQAWCCFRTVESGADGETTFEHVPNMSKTLFDKKHVMDLHDMWLDAQPWNKLFNLSVIREHSLRFDESLSLGEDMMFAWAYLDLMGDTPICVVTEPLYNYVRVGGDSLDSKYRPDMLDIYRYLNSECEKYLKKWNVSDEGYSSFYNGCFYSYEKVMRNNMRAQSSFWKRIRGNSKILKSAEFKALYVRFTGPLHPLYKVGYKLNSYLCIHLVNKASEMKKK